MVTAWVYLPGLALRAVADRARPIPGGDWFRRACSPDGPDADPMKVRQSQRGLAGRVTAGDGA